MAFRKFIISIIVGCLAVVTVLSLASITISSSGFNLGQSERSILGLNEINPFNFKKNETINIYVYTILIALNLNMVLILFYRHHKNRKKDNYANEKIIELYRCNAELESSNLALKNRLACFEGLDGFLPICSSCHKIRDDYGRWNAVESYISERIPVKFSHSICPDCIHRLYPEYHVKTTRE